MVKSASCEEWEKGMNQLERVLDESGLELSTILDLNPHHCLILGFDNCIHWSNRAAFESVNMSRQDLIGQYCYEVWAKRKDPCPNCPVIKAIQTGSPHDTEKTTPDGRIWHIRGYPLKNKNGNVAAALEVTEEITERKKSEEALARQAEFQRLVGNISTDLVRSDLDSFDAGIEHGLALMGQFSGADRAYVFQVRSDGTSMDNTHEWCAEGIEPQIDNLQNIALEDDLPWFAVHIRNHATVHVPDVTALPPEALRDRNHLEAQDIQSLLVLPMVIEGRLVGLVGFDAVRQRRVWSEEDQTILKLASQSFANLIERIRVEEELRKSRENYKRISENSPAVVFQFARSSDGEYTFPYISEGVLRTTGISPEEAVQDSSKLLNLIHPDDRERFRSGVKRSGESLDNFHQVFRHIKDDEVRWVECRATPERRPDGSTLWDGLFMDVTDRKKAEQKLKASEANLRSIFQAARNVAYIRTDVDCEDPKILEFSPGAEQLFGYKAEEVIGRPVGILHLQEDVEKFPEVMRRMQQGYDGFQGESILVRKSGERFPAVFSTCPVFDDQGEMVATIGISVDITELKRAENALWKSERTFRTIIDTALEGIWITDKDGLTTYVNHEIERLLGYSLEEMIGKKMSDFLSQVDVKSSTRKVKNAAQKIGNRTDIRFRRKDGREVLAIVSSTALLDADGEVGGTFSMITDITDRKEAEEELEAIFSMSVDLICIADINSSTFKKVNPSFQRTLGYSEDELLGRAFLGFIHPEDVQPTIDIIEKQLKRGKKVVNFENRYRCKNGGYRWLNWASHPNPARGVTFAVARDETDRKRLESQLRQSQKMESIGTLAGGIAHDFNNALTPIMVQTELAKLTIPGDNPVHRSLDEILNAAHRAKDLIKQILTFSRQSEQQRVPLDFAPLIKESLKLLRSSIPTTIEIKQNVAVGNCVVMADPTQMQQIVMNLCTNASQAMQEMGSMMEVGLTPVDLNEEEAKGYPNVDAGSYVMLTVSDTGTGIEPELMERIFDPFFTTKPTGVGTGMGLSMVHGIVRSHGGDITVRSTPGKGSTFTVVLPRLQWDAHKEGKTSNERVPSGGERILFVDDEAPMVKAGEQMLTRLGYQVDSKTRAIEALAAFRNHPDRYELVITDMTMPDMTGDNLAKELMKVRPDIPVIICTGFSHQIDERKALDMGIRAFVMKPFAIKDIAETIRSVLDVEGARMTLL